MERRAPKSQSAMEYLMTYGWAILIIAVVLAILFQLGVFSGGNFTPKAQAGACQVQKTSAGVSLEGECQGQLPEYVARFNGNSYASVPSSVTPDGITNAFSVFAWVYANTNPGGDTHGDVIAQKCNGACTWFVEPYGNGAGRASPSFYYNGASFAWNTYSTVLNFPLGQWEFVGFVVNGGTITAYADNNNYPVSASYTTNSIAVFPTWIGTRGDGICGSCFIGDIADVQVYNTSLSQNEVNSLYLEGIGGAPIRPQNITAWWPLNGNANDYSGNNNNGQLNSISFNSSWSSSYTAP